MWGYYKGTNLVKSFDYLAAYTAISVTPTGPHLG
jgi:hypothetical protein